MAKGERHDEGPGTIEPGVVTGILRQLAEAPDPGGDPWEQSLRPGAVVGRFELVREIGRGGFGIVYEARDRELGRAVAFKAVRAGERAALREDRLLREAEAAARLSHPNVVTIHDVGRCEQGPYLVLELLHGQTLHDRLAQGPMALREALRVAVEIAKGLAHAHGVGVVHRDLKPANVFLCEDGQVKLLDFGLSHALGRRRIDGGTPAYMAPEQRRGAPEDERTDVFALGALLFRMLAGELPFPEADGGRWKEPGPPAPGLDVPDLPALDAFVRRMLAPDPVDRPRDGAAALAALTAFRGELERTPSPPSGTVRTRRRSRLRVAALAGAALAAMLLAAAGLLVYRGAPAGGPPVSVAVADFANQTGEPELDGLSGMLITSLEQSQRLAVLTRVRMLDLLRQLGKQNVSSVDEALGRELALRAGVRALVLATIRRFDALYAIELKVLDPVTSEYLFTLQEQAEGKASVPAMIDRLSRGTRERLRCESAADLAASRASVAELTTGSLEAYQHYFKAEQLKEAVLYDAAIGEYRKAIAVDPAFALAHYRIAYLGKFTGLEDASRRAEIEAALRAMGRVPAKERLLILAWKAIMDGRAGEASALYARAVEAYPQDKEVLFMAGDQFLHREEYEKGLPFFERAVALDPTFEPALMHVADCLYYLDRNEELARTAREWAQRSPSAVAYRALAVGEAASGRIPEAEDAARRAVDLDGTGYSRATLAQILAHAGRYEEAEKAIRPAIAPTASGLDRAFAVPTLATVLAYQGRLREAYRVVDTLPDDVDPMRLYAHAIRFQLGVGWSPTPEVARQGRELARSEPGKLPAVALGLVLAGDLDGAAALAPRLAPQARILYEAAVAWRRGDPGRALALLRGATSLTSDARGCALWLRAAAAHDAGEDREVIAAVEKLRATPGDAWRTWALLQAELLAAEAHERLGESALARDGVDALLRTLRRADPDLPLLAQARALRARIGRDL